MSFLRGKKKIKIKARPADRQGSGSLGRAAHSTTMYKNNA